MRKFVYLFFAFLFIVGTAKADIDYHRIYEGLEKPDFSYIHGIDPDQYFDMRHYAWSPYPLFRLNTEVYFKDQKIVPGYYLLTPREHDGKWYVLFKDNGVIKATIPCYKNEIVEPDFYNLNLPKEKLTPSQKIHLGFLNTIGRINSSKRQSSPKTYLELEDIDNNFLSMIIYYGSGKYYILLKTK